MLAGRLHSVAVAVKDEFDHFQIISLLSQATTTLQTSISQPNPANAEAFETALESLRSALEKCPSNSFVPSRRKILDSIGGSDKTGLGLSEQIENMRIEEGVTPALMVSRMQELLPRVKEFHQTLSQIITSFETLGIAPEDPTTGGAEIGILMPRELLDDTIGRLTKELHDFHRHLQTFAEVATGDAAILKIRSIGTGSYDLFINSPFEVGACIVFAIERLVALYKEVLEIRAMRRSLEKKVPKEAMKPVVSHETKMINDGIEQLRKDLFREFYSRDDPHRREELQKPVLDGLTFLAKKIDQGVQVEVSLPKQATKELAAAEVTEGTKLTPEQTKLKTIASSGSVMRSLEKPQEPVFRQLEDQSEQVPAAQAGEPEEIKRKPRKRGRQKKT